MKKVLIFGFVLFFVGLLLGFVPQYRRASQFQRELSDTRANVDRERLATKLCGARSDVQIAYYESLLKNYGIASDYFNRFYAAATDVQRETSDSSLKGKITHALSTRDEIASGLGKGDPAVVSELKNAVGEMGSIELW